MLALPSRPNEGGDLTMCVLGCGNMGIAILSGILDSLAALNGPRPLQTDPSSPAEEVPSRLPSRFIACVRRPDSAKRVKKLLWAHSSFVKVVQNDNVPAVARSDIILLACKPIHLQSILTEPGMSKALHGKLLISICAGITVPYLESLLHHGPQTGANGKGAGSANDESAVADSDDDDDSLHGSPVQIVRALPNTAALIQEGMTVIAESEPPLVGSTASLVTWIFRRVGDVVYLPAGSMDASTALVGSAPAFFLLVLEAAIDGAVAMGLPREEATRMAAQSMRGAAGLVLGGEHPAVLRDRVATPGGCTVGGLMVLEEGGARGTVSRAVREAAGVARLLGQGKEAVNGTRFNYSQNGGF